MLPEMAVDLRRPPRGRRCLTPAQCEKGRELLRQYKTDLGLSQDMGELLISIAREHIRDDHWAEMDARNLDWWTENFALGRLTTVCHFLGGQAGQFTTIGRPGLVGAFSGVAPGRFAATLNAVLSLEPAQVATPVALLLRTVLEDESPIPCDCLLLLTGAARG